MVPSGASLCFACGQPVCEPPRLNLLSNGGPCPTCAERVLESLPPLLPSRGRTLDVRGRSDDESEGTSWEARYLPGGEDPFEVDDDRPEPA